MSKRNIFWVRCFPADYLSDCDLQIMDAEQRGIAFWLWMNLYQNNGKIKYNLKRLSAMCRASEKTVQEVILDKFEVVNGYVTHKRVDEELADSNRRHDKAVKASKARWQPKNVGQ